MLVDERGVAVGHVGVEVCDERGGDEGGEGDGAAAGVGLGRSDDPASVEVPDGVLDRDERPVGRDVAAAQGRGFTEAESAEGEGEHEGAVAGRDRGREGVHLGGGQRAGRPGRLGVPAARSRHGLAAMTSSVTATCSRERSNR